MDVGAVAEGVEDLIDRLKLRLSVYKSEDVFCRDFSAISVIITEVYDH